MVSVIVMLIQDNVLMVLVTVIIIQDNVLMVLVTVIIIQDNVLMVFTGHSNNNTGQCTNGIYWSQ